MAKYKARFVKSAKKEFLALPTKVQNRIVDGLELLCVNPFSSALKTKKLKGADNLYRMRFGDYRVIYEIRKRELVVLIVKVGHRREVYRSR